MHPNTRLHVSEHLVSNLFSKVKIFLIKNEIDVIDDALSVSVLA